MACLRNAGRKRRVWRGTWQGILVSCLLSTAQGQTPVKAIAPKKFRLRPQGQVVSIPYASNASLSRSSDQFTRAVVVIHGTLRNANDYYQRLFEASVVADSAFRQALIVAPQFLTEADIEAFYLPESYLYWSQSGWKQGDLSQSSDAHPRPVRVSSFAVVDSILFAIAAAMPQVKIIVIAGHSAGGQFVNRYAAGSPVEPVLVEKYGIHLRYVVANPSSYLYFNEERRVGNSTDQFAVPAGADLMACPGYNDYKYGLANLNSYMARAGSAKIREQYPRREVIYLLGGQDDDPGAAGLDTRCGAMLQGSTRLERGVVYFHYLQHFFGPEILRYQRRAMVPGVGHDSAKMFASSCGVYFLFDYGACQATTRVERAIERAAAKRVELQPNYPNPFNPETTIRVRLYQSMRITLEVVNDTGELIKTLVQNEFWPAGLHVVSWDGCNQHSRRVGSGVYYCRLVAPHLTRSLPLCLIR
ncbi:MAG: hypothetical protein D6814_05085 [Calditrichaeota bacterium]|nr:MAG: hypothetical protein D6814_05085 [Calditrichota bacterium]